MATFTAIPQLVVDFSYFTPAGKKETLTIREGDILKDVVYKDMNGKIQSKTGKVTAIMTTETKSTTNYGSCACSLASSFRFHVTVDGFVIDSSDVYEADTNMIFVKDLQSIGGIVEGKKEVDLTALPEGGLAAVIAELQPGQELKLGAGEITEELVLPAGVTIRGANAGVSAAKGYRAQGGVIEGETVINAPITAIEGDIILDGITLAGKAAIVAGEESNVVVSNTRLVDLVAATKSDAAVRVEGNDKAKPIKVVVMNCYFGDTVGEEGKDMAGIYNLINLHGNLQSGSVIKNCHFSANCCTNNIINIYRVNDGGHIDIANNVFEKSCNAIRIAGYEDMNCVVNCTNNTYNDTFAADGEDRDWAGLVLIQPSELATTMSNVVVNIDGTVNNSGNDTQIWYYYAGSKEPQFEGDDLPKVFVDGVKQNVEEHIAPKQW